MTTVLRSPPGVAVVNQAASSGQVAMVDGTSPAAAVSKLAMASSSPDQLLLAKSRNLETTASAAALNNSKNVAASTPISTSSPRETPTSHVVIASLTSGAMAGAIAKTVIAPLDRTKIYFQTHPDKSYRIKRALRYLYTTYKNEGFLFLWRGNSATMARIVPYASVQFLAHDQYKRILGIHADQTKHEDSDTASRKLRHFMAGSLAGMTGQVLTYPLDRARAVMAVTRIGEYKNLMDVFRRTIKNEGIPALYRGFVPTILGVIPYAGTSFFTYEQLKAFWTAKARQEDPSNPTPAPTTLQRLSSGAIAGLLGQTTSYPLDIVRRRMQTATQMGVSQNRYATILGTLTVILRKEGIRKGWFKGVSMNFIKGPIAVGISFTTFDYFNHLVKEGLKSLD